MLGDGAGSRGATGPLRRARAAARPSGAGPGSAGCRRAPRGGGVRAHPGDPAGCPPLPGAAGHPARPGGQPTGPGGHQRLRPGRPPAAALPVHRLRLYHPLGAAVRGAMGEGGLGEGNGDRGQADHAPLPSSDRRRAHPLGGKGRPPPRRPSGPRPGLRPPHLPAAGGDLPADLPSALGRAPGARLGRPGGGHRGLHTPRWLAGAWPGPVRPGVLRPRGGAVGPHGQGGEGPASGPGDSAHRAPPGHKAPHPPASPTAAGQDAGALAAGPPAVGRRRWGLGATGSPGPPAPAVRHGRRAGRVPP